MDRAGPGRLAILAAVLTSATGCFQPPMDCLRAGACECITSADCADGLDCVNGFCGELEGDAGPVRGEFGAFCERADQCFSGLCLPPGAGRPSVCTVAC